MTNLLQDTQKRVGFEPRDAALLARLSPRLLSHVPQVVESLVVAALRHADVRSVVRIHGDMDTVEAAARSWLEALLRGPFDADYADQRVTLGAALANAGLTPRHLIAAMSHVRLGLAFALRRETVDVPVFDQVEASEALTRALDLELALVCDACHGKAEDLALTGAAPSR